LNKVRRDNVRGTHSSSESRFYLYLIENIIY